MKRIAIRELRHRKSSLWSQTVSSTCTSCAKPAAPRSMSQLADVMQPFPQHTPQRRFLTTENMDDSSSNKEKPRPDPMARRPTAKCDPFGQGGKPLTMEGVMRLSSTVDPEWQVESTTINTIATNKYTTSKPDPPEAPQHPMTLVRTFQHPDFLSAASFLQHVAAVAQMNDHFPQLTMERQLESRKKQWTVISKVTCHTKVLGGLSHHDFFLATLIDVEIERPELKGLLRLPDHQY